MNRNFEAAQGAQRRVTSGLGAYGLRAMAGDEFALTGYAAMYNSWSKDLGGFKERILPTAFTRSLMEGADVKALFNHQPDNILGRTKSGTLTLSHDMEGLRFRCVLNRQSQAHRDLYEAVKRGDIDECSFAFTVPQGGDSWEDGTDPEDNSRKIALRTLKDVDLLDVSVVTYPAYDRTSVGARGHKPGYSKKAPANPSEADVRFAIETLRKAAQASAKIILASAHRELGFNTHEAISGHLQLAHEMAEASFAMSETAQSLLHPSNPDLDYDDEDSLRSLRKTHEFAHEAARLSCQHFAKTRMAHSKMRRLTAGTIKD